MGTRDKRLASERWTAWIAESDVNRLLYATQYLQDKTRFDARPLNKLDQKDRDTYAKVMIALILADPFLKDSHKWLHNLNNAYRQSVYRKRVNGTNRKVAHYALPPRARLLLRNLAAFHDNDIHDMLEKLIIEAAIRDGLETNPGVKKP